MSKEPRPIRLLFFRDVFCENSVRKSLLSVATSAVHPPEVDFDAGCVLGENSIATRTAFQCGPDGCKETRRPGSNLCRQLRHKIGEGEGRLGAIVSKLRVSVSISHCRFPGYAWHHRSMMTFTAPHSNFILATVADCRRRVDCAIGGG